MTRAELESNREEIEEARKSAAAAQRVFWDAMSDLESAMGFNVDLDEDLEDVTVDDLIEEHAEDENYTCPGCSESVPISQSVKAPNPDIGTALGYYWHPECLEKHQGLVI